MAQENARARERLVDELRDAVGDEAVERTDLDVDRAIDRRPRTIRTAFESSRLLLLVIGGTLLVTGVVASLALENWLLLPVALAIHFLVAVIVIGTAFVLTEEGEKPSPTAEAMLAEEGVADPERALSDLVEQVEEQESDESRTGVGRSRPS
jgi:hypothetical protein